MITIRQARQDDAAILAAIGFRAWEDATRSIQTNDEIRENARSAFAHFTLGAWHCILVAESDGTLAGWAARENSDDMISDFWIDPFYQRQGIGEMLLDELEAQVLAAGFPSVKLESHADNEKALSFFRKHGYEVSWLSMKYARKLDREVQSIGLRKQLKDFEMVTYGPSF